MFPLLLRRATIALLVSAISSGLTPRAFAAAGETLFEDDYSVLDSGFGEASDEQRVEGNNLVINLDKNLWYRVLYQSMIFDDADVAVRVQLPDMNAKTGAGVGLMFWADASNNAYVLEISDAGDYAVRRFTPQRTLTPLSWRHSDAVHTEPGAWNELRVVTVGNRATIFINGRELATIRGRVPEDGSLVGVFTETFDAPVEGRFSAFKVVEPAVPTNEGELNDPQLILADDFAAFDPAWGAESDWLGVRDGQLFIELNANESYTTFNQSALIDGDVDATVTATVDDAVDGEGNVVSSGLAFWGQDYENFYVLEVYDDGTMGVFRRIGERWLAPIAVRAVPEAAQMDLPQGVELRVVTHGRKATLYVNGVEIGTISGQPPKNESLVGLYCQSGEGSAVTLFDKLMIRQPETN